MKAGPLIKVKEPSFWLYTRMPVISAGSRSGVNCTRLKPPSTERARALARVVLPVPGTSSSSTWPPASSAVSVSSISRSLPTITRPIFSAMRFASGAMAAYSITILPFRTICGHFFFSL